MKNTINLSDLINIYRMLHPTTAEYTLFSSVHRTFTMIETIFSAINVFIYLKIFKSYKVTTMELN